jgi:hypothetical protein
MCPAGNMDEACDPPVNTHMEELVVLHRSFSFMTWKYVSSEFRASQNFPVSTDARSEGVAMLRVRD